MSQAVKSPCIEVCKIDADTGLCHGCLRTRAEIAHWMQYSESERRAILKDLATRQG